MSDLMLVRIKEGAKIGHDFAYGNWPACKPPISEYTNSDDYEEVTKYPNALFEALWTGKWWDCRRDGYGMLKSENQIGEYGNGSIFVFHKDGVEIVSKNYQPKLLPNSHSQE